MTEGKGKQRERDWVQVAVPTEPHEAAYPIRSRSPKPSSPDLRREGNPFESDEDLSRLSPRTAEWGLPDVRVGGDPLGAGR